MKIIIIGRGSSCLNCNREFVETHDLICVVNKFIFRGYEKYVGNKADVQFRNRSTAPFTKNELEELELKKIVYVNLNGYNGLPPHYNGLEIVKPNPPLKTEMSKQYKFDQSSGIVAIYYALKEYNVTELTLVGFDFYEVGSKPYYFKPQDADNNLKYLWKGAYKNNKINLPSGHSNEKSIEFVIDTIKNNPNIKFNVITNSSRFKNINEKNIKLQ
jgi:hypothetical protein